MRTPHIAFLLLLLAGAASAQQPGSTSYTPSGPNDAPTFMNAEVVRVDRAGNRVTFRSESRDTTLTVEGEALTSIASLHAGDKVVVGYRVATDADGREVRYVTTVRAASPSSGEPGQRVASMTPGSTVRARVLSYDRGRRRVTVIDESGTLRALPVAKSVTSVGSLVPGSNVAFNLGGSANAVNVNGVTSLGDTPVFANGGGFPAVNGQFVSFNPRTGFVTLDTPNAGRVTFPAGNNVAGGFSGLRPGENLSLNFDVTTGARQAQNNLPAGSGTRTSPTGTAQGLTTPLATITGVQSATGGQNVQAAGVPGAVSPISQNTASVNAPGLAGTPGATTGNINNQGVNNQGVNNQGGNQQGGNQQGVIQQQQQQQGNPQRDQGNQGNQRTTGVNNNGNNGVNTNGVNNTGVNGTRNTGVNNTGVNTGGGNTNTGVNNTGVSNNGNNTGNNTGVSNQGGNGTAQSGGNAAGSGNQAGNGGNQSGNGGQTGSGGGGLPIGGLAPGTVGGPVGGVVPAQGRGMPSVPNANAVMPAVLPPALAKEPLSAADVGTQRLQGEADLDNAAVALAAAAGPIDAAWSGFKVQCLRGFTAETVSAGREWYLLAQGRVATPSDDGCRAMFSDLTARANGFMQQLDIVEDAARKADVLPVRVRETFDRHRLR